MAANQCVYYPWYLIGSSELMPCATDRKAAGLYAARVTGRPPPDVVEAIEAKGGTYRPRDEVEE